MPLLPRAASRARVNALFAALLALLAIGALSCTDEEAERRAAQQRTQERRSAKEAVTKRLAPDVRTLIGKVDQLRNLLSSVPRAPEDGAPPPTDPPMKLSELDMKDPAGNADVMFVNELTLLKRGMVGTCSYYLRNGSDDDSAELLEDVFRRGLRTRYFLVIRVDEQKKPKLSGGNHYTDGSLDGDVAVFDLSVDPPKPLGSFPIKSELTETVKVRASANQESVQYALDEAMRKTALTAIGKVLPR